MPDFNPTLHHRRSIRLKGYDYSQDGMYFITVCTHQHENLFGEIRVNNGEAEMALNEFGRLVDFTWQDLPNHNPRTELGPFVIMPNHIHGIIALVRPDPVRADPVRAGSKPAPDRAGLEPAPTNTSLSEIVRQLKTFSARRINQARNTSGSPVWQRNYWEHIIRSDESARKITEYIANNPQTWQTDQLFTHPIP